MADLVVSGNTSGAVTLRAPDVSGTTLLTLPTTSGTLVVTGGAQTIEFADGTVSAPSITNSGDTNTGIFFPAADTIAFTEGGAEAMRIDSSGRLLIGTTSGTRKLTVYENAAQVDLSIVSSTTGLAVIQMGDTAADNQGQIIYRNNGDSMEFAVNGAERMRIDSSGNVGIGTSSPSYKVDVVGSPNDEVSIRAYNSTAGSLATARVYAQSDTALIQIASFSSTFGFNLFGTNAANYSGLVTSGASSAGLMLGTLTSDPIIIGTADAERMRITSGGEVYIAGTTDQGAYNLQVNGTGVWGAGAYVNGSDERIKDNIAPLDSGLDVVAKLNPVTYKYKENWSKDQSTQTGFIAQELLTALEGKNYIDGVVQQGGEYMSVAYQNIIPILTKAIQELKAELDEAKAEIQALKGAR